MNISIVIIILTSLLSYVSFQNKEMFNRLKLNPYLVVHRKEYLRVIGHGFVHADWLHLIVNMIVLFSFGPVVEDIFVQLNNSDYIGNPRLFYILFYLGGILIASTYSIWKYRNQHYYNSVGASGAVSAVVFICIFFFPMNKIYIYGILGIPGIVLGPIYLIYSIYMAKQNKDNVDHTAHIFGALYGFLFPLFIKPDLILYFFDSIKNYFNS